MYIFQKYMSRDKGSVHRISPSCRFLWTGTFQTRVFSVTKKVKYDICGNDRLNLFREIVLGPATIFTQNEARTLANVC